MAAVAETSLAWSASAAAARPASATPASVDRSVAALAPRRSDAREAVAEALIRLRGDLEKSCRLHFRSLDAEEVYQRASLRALERSASLRDQDRVDGWIRRVVATSALDLLRERRGETALLEEHELEAPATEDGVCACALALMKSLPESYEDIIRRVDIDRARLAEVAGSLKIATGNAAVRLHRARRALRHRLREHCGVETMHQCLTCVCNERGCCGTAP